jgi:RimJ/RimL family protein N-acetyltransferase
MNETQIKSERLLLRPSREADIPEIVRLLNDPAIAETTLNIPYPYSEKTAREWLTFQQQRWESGDEHTFVIIRQEDNQLLGAIGIRPNARHKKAEIGYWIGKPYWGQGYATEAARAITRYGFEILDMNRIYASHLPENPASGRVMQKVGMQFEGVLRQDVRKGDQFLDHAVYAILREEWERR